MAQAKLHKSLYWLITTLLFSFANCIEHDSLHCLETGDCPEASHTVIKLAKRDDQLARRIADEHNMVLLGKPFLDSHYFLAHSDSTLPHRRKRSTIERLSEHPDVRWLSEQRPRVRRKRDHVSVDVFGPREKRDVKQLPVPKLPFKDPLYGDQWYLVGRAFGGYDMNVREAWLMGYAGRNVSISILDDGIQRDHPDIMENYDPLASTDINDHDDDPTPQNNGDNKHGTRCAGEVAAVAGNDVCGVGVAFKSMIGGVRMLDGPVSDSVEAASLNLNQDHIDIYSASWGPEDDGKTFDGPGALAQEAFYKGIKQGRGGKGNIFVWASGNGGSRQDSCSADGYTTSIYTLSISSTTFDNRRPWYLEECPSTIASTYSSANINQPAIVTVDVPSGCTKMHTGTSASAPLAAGIIALALEANPQLTWRDMQHLVLRTANPTPLLGNPGWSINGVGRRISNKFGYGLMDAGALVKLARVWKAVPEQHMCTYEYTLDSPRPRPLLGHFAMNFTLNVDGCQSGTPVLYLEHVHVITTIRYGKRGDLKLTLYSPSGTKSVLLPPRPQDFNQNGFHKWPFLTVQMWGEDPRGTWTLTVESVSNNPKLGGMFSDWSLLLYGTQDPAQPTDPKYNPRESVHKGNALSQGLSSITSQTETASPEESTITFGDLRSAPDCHAECRGCTESNSAAACFACKHFTQSLRNRAGFRCVSHCDEGFYADGDKCKKCSVKCKTCKEAEICETCPGAELLVDVDHYGHLDHHGKCVKECSDGLIADYTNLIQARCVLKKNPCSDGYYLDIRGTCAVCDEACATCHGPGAMQCDSCSSGYGNRSIGYCRPCCAVNETAPDNHCEDCSSTSPIFSSEHGGSSGFGSFVIVVCVVVIFSFVIYMLMQLCQNSSKGRADLEYTPLKTTDTSGLNPAFLSDDSDSDDGLNEHILPEAKLVIEPSQLSPSLSEKAIVP